MLKFNIITLIFVFISGIANAFEDLNLKKTWNEARVYVPGDNSFTFVTNYKALKKYPVILYMHGCSGISDINDVRWARLLRENGYLVIMPNSFSRNNKTSFCDHRIWKKADINDALFRVDELTYALEMLSNSNWDNGNIFIMGHSQGAWAVAMGSFSNVNAVILSSLMCTRRFNFQNSIPILRIGFANDPWDDVPVLNCPVHQTNINLQQEIVRGRDHETYNSRYLRNIVLEYLKNNAHHVELE